MRLSEAILLGDSLKKGDAWQWNAINGRGCGCAIAGARLAIGDNGTEIYPWKSDKFVTAFPWLTDNNFTHISLRYIKVAQGRQTLEELAEWVDSIDPTPRDSQESVATSSEVNSEKVTPCTA